MFPPYHTYVAIRWRNWGQFSLGNQWFSKVTWWFVPHANMHKVQWLKLIYYEVSFFVRITQLTFLSCFWYLIIIILIIILYWSNTKMEDLRFNHGSVTSPKFLFVNRCTITSPMRYAVLHRTYVSWCNVPMESSCPSTALRDMSKRTVT